MALIPETRITVKVNQANGVLTPTTPVTIKNQVNQLNSIQDIPGVNEAEITNGAVIVYNANTQQYDIKPLDIHYLIGEIDGGTY